MKDGTQQCRFSNLLGLVVCFLPFFLPHWSNINLSFSRTANPQLYLPASVPCISPGVQALHSAFPEIDRGFQLQPPPSPQTGGYLKCFQFSTNVSNRPRQQRIHCPSLPSLPGWSLSWLELEFASMMQDGHHGVLQRTEWSLGTVSKLTTLVVTLNMCVVSCRVPELSTHKRDI